MVKYIYLLLKTLLIFSYISINEHLLDIWHADGKSINGKEQDEGRIREKRGHTILTLIISKKHL